MGLFYASALIVLICAVLSLSLNNPVRSVMFLALSFIGSALSFILVGAQYVAMTLIIVYAGAVAILFLFVVMMLDLDLTPKKRLTPQSVLLLLLPPSVITSLCYAESSGKLAVHSDTNVNACSIYEIAIQLYQGQHLIILGCVLLIAMVGAIILTFKNSEDRKRQNTFAQVHRKKSDCVSLVNVKNGEGVKI